ncbi:MAG: restriction endonuclease [Chloroflexi bacterium]|nr:restriction endonuclease [Chloroflexota bacterium]MBI5081259.1 restriction endonuclease [Chloroflexota bacterium]MBI5715948.1 restriction endonuclease [Chloroflexota bacterium]
MANKRLTLSHLIAEARNFCKQAHRHKDLYGVTDGKAVGTFIEHLFVEHLISHYAAEQGNSASGLDLPTLNVDIKVTSMRQPQSSCPFQSARQKLYGLGYHLLLFVYDKKDNAKRKISELDFVRCAFIDQSRTADYQTTRGILDILARSGNRDDVLAFLYDRNLPGDEITYNALADEIMQHPPTLGYLTISNALQWRLQYGRVVNLSEPVEGITAIR